MGVVQRGVKKLMGGPTMRYGQTKLANILFTSELARRLEGTGVIASCFDPGLVATNFNQDNGFTARLTMAVMKPFSRTAEVALDMDAAKRLWDISEEQAHLSGK